MITPVITTTYKNRKPLRFYPRTWRGWLLLFSITLLFIIGCAYLLARQTPGWYQPPNINSDQVLDAADAAQEKIRQIALDLHNTLGKLPLGDQQWTITQDEVNSLLAVRFANFHATEPIQTTPSTASQSSLTTPKPIQNIPENPSATAPRKSDFLSGPLVMFTPGKVTCGARTPKIPSSDPAGGVMTVVFVVETRTEADGMVMGLIKVDSAWAGLLPVPKFLVENRIRELVPSLIAAVQRAMAFQLGVKDSSKMGPQVEAAIEGIGRGESFPLNFVYEKQKVLVKEIRVDDGSLTIVFARSTVPTTGPQATIKMN